jgi:type II secretory pathway component PulK
MNRQRGAVLITLLMVTMVVVMFMGALLMRSRSNLFNSSQYRDSLKAEQAARAGVNHLLSLLESDPTWTADLQATWSGATYKVTFPPPLPSR